VREARWTPLDYLDCGLYVITPEARGFYRLDNLMPRRVPAATSTR